MTHCTIFVANGLYFRKGDIISAQICFLILKNISLLNPQFETLHVWIKKGCGLVRFVDILSDIFG